MRSKLLRCVLTALSVTAFSVTTDFVPFSGAQSLKDNYSHAYYTVAHHHSKAEAGRNIRRFGLKGGHKARGADLRASLTVLDRILHPPVSVAQTAQTSTSIPTPQGNGGGGSGGGGANGIAACIRQHENGGSYTGTDPSGTYGGAYQFDQQTWTAAGGTGSPASASPAEQDRVFNNWWPGHHSAWPVSGPACGG